MTKLARPTKAPKSLDLADGSSVSFEQAADTVIFPANATYDKPFTFSELVEIYAIVAYIRFGLASGQSVRLLGDPGVGKSAAIRCFLAALGIPTVIIPAPNRAPEDMVSVYPSKCRGDDGLIEWVIERKLDAGLTADEPFVLILEEVSRAQKDVRNQLLELCQNKTLADVKINAIAVFACDNSAAAEGFSSGLDRTLSDRFSTFEIKPNDLPWREALASKYSTVDLNGAYKVMDEVVDPVLRRALSNRTFEHILFCLLNNMPGSWGLGIRESRNFLVDGAGNDRTDEIIDKIAAAIGVRQPTSVSDRFIRAFNASLQHGVNLIAIGPPGIGKTSFVKARLVEEGIHPDDILVLSGPVAQPENMVIQIPDGDSIRPVLMDWFSRPASGPKGKVLVIDEIWRATGVTRNRFLEILQERTLGGVKPRDLKVVMALNNPRNFAGMDLDTYVPDLAQSDRFFMSIEITSAHIPWQDFLLRTYGEIAEPFLTWWNEILSPEMRDYVSARTLERMIGHYIHGVPLKFALVYNDDPGGESGYDGIPLLELEKLLADRPLTYFKAIIDQVDDYEASLRDGQETDQEQLIVYMAMSNANITMLEKHRVEVVRLCRHLNRQNWVQLLSGNKERQKFFREVLSETR